MEIAGKVILYFICANLYFSSYILALFFMRISDCNPAFLHVWGSLAGLLGVILK